MNSFHRVLAAVVACLTIVVCGAQYAGMRIEIEKVWAERQYDCECITDECVEAKWYASTTINN